MDRKSANAVGGRTARACDNCLRCRARWFCAADDAFLCHGCDASVHSANQLASRHERARLHTASNRIHNTVMTVDDDLSPPLLPLLQPPAWHHGFTRKARTPRHHAKFHKEKTSVNPAPLVPEIWSEEGSSDENTNDQEQLLYQVPIYDPFVSEIKDQSVEKKIEYDVEDQSKVLFFDDGCDTKSDIEKEFHGFLPSEMDLAEFAADVESLLGRETLDEDGASRTVKVEDEEEVEAVAACLFDPVLGMARETLDWNFDYDSPVKGEEVEEEEDKVVVAGAETLAVHGGSRADESRRKMCLRLNYEAVMNAWASQGSPWTTGNRPEVFNPDDCFPDFMGMCPTNNHSTYGDAANGIRGQVGRLDGGDREARVTRYREKRRTRLFSKKIRYEVRKLNAENRPRMKGRFVKRSSLFTGPTAFPMTKILEDVLLMIAALKTKVLSSGKNDLVLVGHSIGAYITIEMFKRCPKKVIYCICLYPFLALNPESPWQSNIRKMAA
ncbi:Lipid droplet-associated hydrolase [Dillenia turbinata]|uniref:Lipid droplet-associated hydrolase n=1 Tax=Dillenia turbinata TaxID=194707 RepID=A0AAN8V5I9_9MAGN